MDPVNDIDAVIEADAGPIRSSVIVCQYRVFAYGNTVFPRKDPRITVAKESDPLVIVYSGLDTERPTIKGHGGEAPLVTVADDGDQIVLVERNGIGSVFTDTLSMSNRRGIYLKSYFLVGGMFSYMTIGTRR